MFTKDCYINVNLVDMQYLEIFNTQQITRDNFIIS